MRGCIFVMLALLSTALSHSQNDSLTAIRLRGVTLSAFHVNDSLMDAAASIAVLGPADLQANDNSTISNAVNRVPGVSMQSGSYNTNRISVRGIGARTPYGTNKIRAFYGSIPLTSGDSETTIEDLDVENLAAVEIIKGPLSPVYGAGLGGAILIRPKLVSGFGHSGSLSTTVGSFRLLKNSLAYSLDKTNASIQLSYHRLESDGWRENSSYRREGITLSGELLRTETSKLTYLGNYTYLKAYIPSSVDRETFENDPRAAAANWLAAKGFEQYDNKMGGLSYDWQPAKGIRNSSSVFATHKKTDEPRPFDILRQNTTAWGARTQFTGRVSRRAEVLMGAEFFNDDFRSRKLENRYQQNDGNGSLAGDLLSAARQQRRIWNVFAQLKASLLRRLEIQAGLNYNSTRFSIDDRFPEDARASNSYAYDGIWSPQAALLYRPDRYRTLYFSASRGFSMPAIEETLTPDGSVNPDIRPENGYNLELGAKGYFFGGRCFAELSLFRMTVHDLLVAQRIGDDQYVGVNAGETRHQGLETAISWEMPLANDFFLKPFANGSFGEYRFVDFVNQGNDFSGNRLTGVASATANAGITASMGALYVSVDFRYVGKIPLDDANSVYNDAYRVWNAKAGCRLKLFSKTQMELFSGINNLLDARYASMILPNATTPPNGSPRYYYPASPAQFYAGLSMRFN